MYTVIIEGIRQPFGMDAMGNAAERQQNTRATDHDIKQLTVRGNVLRLFQYSAPPLFYRQIGYSNIDHTI